MFQYHAVMNVHVIIRWSALYAPEHKATAVLGKYLNCATKWFATGETMLHRQRRFEPMREGRDLDWVYVHEKSPEYGFHTHILMSLHLGYVKDFELWSRRTLARLAGQSGLAGSHALRFRRTYSATVDDVVADCWRWYCYLMKQLDPMATIKLRGSLKEVSAREVLMPWHFRKSLPLETCRGKIEKMIRVRIPITQFFATVNIVKLATSKA